MLVAAIVLVLAGLTIAAVGLLGLRERLPRNRFFGVRTTASMRTDESFRLANKIAGLPLTVGGLAGAASGIAGLLVPTTGGSIVSVLIGLVGMLAITIGAGLLGHRATLAVPEPEPELPPGCKGCQCGNCPVSVRANVSGVRGQ